MPEREYIGQTKTVDGVTVRLEYAIVDTVQLELSYTSVSVYDEPVRVTMG